MASKDYGIGIAYGLGIKDGNPENHTLNKLKKLGDMLYSGEIQRGIIAVGSNGEANINTLKDLGLDKYPIDRDNGKSFVDHMYNIQNTVDGLIRDGVIPTDVDVKLFHITNYYSKGRAEFNAKWVIKKYRSEVIEVEDGRPKEVIWEIDESQEPKRMRTDKAASIISKYLKIRPDIAQIIVFPFCNPSRLIAYGKRFLPA
jgi:hypothetical protein